MNFVIEKNVAVPMRSKLGGLLETMRAMEIGDSFLYPLPKRTDVAATAARAGIKTTTRKVSETEVRV